MASSIRGISAREAAVIRCREMVTGKPLPLMSKFRLSYYTLLNILRRLEGSGQSMEYVIARSFQQFQFEQSLPQVCRPLAQRATALGLLLWYFMTPLLKLVMHLEHSREYSLDDVALHE